ncbi:unnamed protein product [Spodoptera littoralis]|uniref:CRC domain-containing protein n=1 Tax=Spodoptera littoralis TaxID=7109 RepID=A0A9P0I5G9_SPOLI|nr:unnamed protein product [Spodoptera littoralis]CAH1639258.1 unnamed protein product [Spodoptera littoralis]
MEHNLDDSLNLESAMGNMDFDHEAGVVSQEDIPLETTGHEPDIPMEFESIEEQQMLMDTGTEEIIVSDFMNDQYTLQEYSVQDDSVPETSGLDEVHGLNVMQAQEESMIDLQFEPDIPHSMTQEVTTTHTQPKYIAVKAAIPRKKNETVVTSNPPRQVPIAPKPPKLVPSGLPMSTATFSSGKQYAIAPKPVALVTTKNANVVKKMTLSSVIQGGAKSGNSFLTQIGKQLVMVPASGGQKIKLVTSGSGLPVQYVRASSDQAELIKNVSSGNTQKPVLAKVIVQGQSNTDPASQSAVITKLLPSSSAANLQTRYVIQQKTVPISIGTNKVIMASPTNQGVKFAKKQLIAIKSPTSTIAPATTPVATTTKKVVITANPSQNVILKTTAPPKTAQIKKDGNVVIQGQRSQIHQINVPGKGVQYIRLITNPITATQKQFLKGSTSAVAAPSKSFVLSDSKGNLIQMTAEKMDSGQPPPLVLTGSTTAKITTKPKKLVRIAPGTVKPAQTVQLQQQSARSSQSLLAPLSPMAEHNLEEVTDLLDGGSTNDEVDVSGNDAFEHSGDREIEREADRSEDERESKAALRALIADTVGEDSQDNHGVHEIEIDFERRQSSADDENTNSMDHDSSHRSDEHPLIVIPSSFNKQMREERSFTTIEHEVLPYLSPKASQALSESDLVSGDLGLRPRKACNCTKSQCLKLYCDCFANGEFCNRCNCNNCHNNLENEELRQKAIRACLDRNPNAFRPKIGKSKTGGPDIIRRHNKGCNCKRSGCLKNYCECYEAKIACTSMCKCVGCRNVEETLERRRDAMRLRDKLSDPMFRPPAIGQVKQPCSFMTSEVIEAVCQCLLAAGVEGDGGAGDGGAAAGAGAGLEPRPEPDPMRDVIEEFARCLQDIISASHQSTSLSVLDDVSTDCVLVR